MPKPMTHNDGQTMGCCDALAHLADAMCACCCQEDGHCATDEAKAACCACKDSILVAMEACLACIRVCCKGADEL